MIYDEATCYKCGANAWTSCKHREATRQPPVDDGHKDRREKAALRHGGGRYSMRTSNGSWKTGRKK